MNFVWRKEWIKAYETPWSIFEKLAFANRLERNDILRFFGNDDVKRIKNPNIGDSRRELIQLSGFNATLLNNVFESDLVGDCKQSVGTLIEPLNYFRERLDKWFREHLHWCHDCLSHGYHSWFHQFVLIKRCPFHESILLDCCPKCGERIPFLLSDKGLSNPFTCICGYLLTSCFGPEWKNGWSEPIDCIQDPTVGAWLSQTTKSNTQSQWLFLPQHTSISLLTVEGQPTVFSHQWRKSTKPNEECGDPIQIQKELNQRNKVVFKAVERHIRKKMLKKHRCCIRSIQGLLKAQGEDFQPICPYAYAYVFWRTTVLKSTRFYFLPWGDDIDVEGGVAAQIISEEISYLKSRFLHHSKTETSAQINQLYWIIDKFTLNFCFNFFRQWLQQAGKGASEVRVPNWQQINQMVECSFPQMAFKYSVAPGDDTLIECYFKSETTNEPFKYECPFITRAAKQSLGKMKSYSPQAVAMMVYDNPTEQNKQLQRYVDKYVRKLIT